MCKRAKNAMKCLVGVLLCLSLVACGGNTEKESVFDVAKDAYGKIEAAYAITEQFGSDVYEAWRIGIYDVDELMSNGVGHLASELSLSEDDIVKGIALVLTDDGREPIQLTKSRANLYFRFYEDSMFSFCVLIVANAYEANGKSAEAQGNLDSAKELMKRMSEKYSDYEHYPNLKKYFTTTKSFFAFCQDPTGSFEQVKDTINDYKNDAREYRSDLDYIFEE